MLARSSPRLLRHLDLGPVCPQYVERPGPHSIPHQDIHIVFHIQGVVGLLQVNEDDMEERLPRGNALL